MSSDPLAAWWNTSITVERRTGTGASGDVYATATTELGYVDDGDKLVLTSDGKEVVSSARVFLPAATVYVPAGSRVTWPNISGQSRRTIVLTASLNASGLPTPDHLELALQ